MAIQLLWIITSYAHMEMEHTLRIYPSNEGFSLDCLSAKPSLSNRTLGYAVLYA